VTIHTPRLLFVAKRLVEYATGKLNVRGAVGWLDRVRAADVSRTPSWSPVGTVIGDW